MTFFYSVTPTEATNLVKDPSFESATISAQWTAQAGITLTASTDPTKVVYGLQAARFQCTTTNTNGIYTDLSANLANATTYVTFYLTSGTLPSGFRVGLSSTATTTITNASTVTAIETQGSVTRYLATFTGANSNGLGRLYLALPAAGSITADIYLDGVQCEQTTAGYTTFIDGDQGDGYEWGGVRLASSSTRYAWYANKPVSGGYVQALDDTSSVLVTGFSGVGVPPVKNIAQDKALERGALFQSSQIDPRTVLIRADLVATSLATLETTRATLLGKIAIGQPFELRYANGLSTLAIWVVYDNGLTFTAPESGYAEALQLTLIAYDEPLWRLVTRSGVSLSLQTADSTIPYLGLRTRGAWRTEDAVLFIYAIAVGADKTVYIGGRYGAAQVRKRTAASTYTDLAVATGGDAVVYALALSLDGTRLYAGGSFTSIGGTAANNIAYMTIATGAWSAMGTGANGTVNALYVGADGTLYIGGAFSQLSGTARPGIGAYTGSAYASLQSGVSGGAAAVYALAGRPNGDVLVVGNFTAASQASAPGAPTVTAAAGGSYSPGQQMYYQITALTGTGETTQSAAGNATLWAGQGTFNVSWSGVTNATGYNIYRASNVGGPYYFIATTTATSFADNGSYTNQTKTTAAIASNTTGGRTTNTAFWRPADSAFYSLGSVGLGGGAAYAVASLRDGVSAVIGGAFTSADSQTANAVCVFNGSALQPLGTGVSGGTVRAVLVDADNSVVIGGSFTSAGGSSLAANLARWVGGIESGVWLPLDIVYSASMGVLSLALRYRDLLVGTDGGGFGSSTYAYLNTVTYSGTANGRPQLVITGPTSGSLVVRGVWIENVGAALFNLSVYPNESVIIDLDANTVTSGVRGNRFRDVLQFARLYLRPGANRVALLGTGTVTGATARLIDRTSYLSADQ